MKKTPTSQSGFLNLRTFLAFFLCLIAVSLAMFSFAAPPTRTAKVAPNVPFVPNTPTFGHPIISGIGGVGFEQDLRLDPSNPNRLYTSAPGTLSANTSWIWHSL